MPPHRTISYFLIYRCPVGTLGILGMDAKLAYVTWLKFSHSTCCIESHWHMAYRMNGKIIKFIYSMSKSSMRKNIGMAYEWIVNFLLPSLVMGRVWDFFDKREQLCISQHLSTYSYSYISKLLDCMC